MHEYVFTDLFSPRKLNKDSKDYVTNNSANLEDFLFKDVPEISYSENRLFKWQLEQGDFYCAKNLIADWIK